MTPAINTFKSLEQLKAMGLKTKNRFQNGELVYISDEQKYYYYQDKQWHIMPDKVKMDSEGASVNLYDMNKQIMAQLPPIIDFSEKMEEITKWHKDHMSTQYFTLMCKEKSYFTVFEEPKFSDDPVDFDTFAQAVINCAKDLGTIVSIDTATEQDTIEFWIKNDNEIFIALLFDSDQMFVRYRGY